jgi:predicted Ser/Thr protein kinase
MPVSPVSDDPERRPRFPDLPGYTVLGRLGAGGTGVVFRAREDVTGRVVALKLFHYPPFRAAVADRFHREVTAQARLRHPHIVAIYTAAVHGGVPFIVMEYVSGGTLAERLQAGALTPAAAAALVEKVAGAVQAAHDYGVLHRDVKPSNILLPEEHRPLLADFGLAKIRDVDDDLTVTAAPLGTASYMSPEQAAGRGDAIGPATDVWGLGVVLYECVTGRRPFQGECASDTIRQVIEGRPAPPRAVRPDVPRELEAICLKCLSKNPAERYPTAAALAADLERFRQGRPVRARSRGRIHGVLWAVRRRGPWGVLLFAYLASLWAVIPSDPAAPITLREAGEARESRPTLSAEEGALADYPSMLRRGQPVALIGASGLPRWYRHLTPPADAGIVETASGEAAFRSAAPSLVSLMPDVGGVERFTVTAEVRLLERSRVAGACVGLFVADRRGARGAHRVAGQMVALAVAAPTRSGRPASDPQSVDLISFVLDDDTGVPGGRKSVVGRRSLAPAADNFPTPFRRLRLDVGPDGMTGYVDGGGGEWVQFGTAASGLASDARGRAIGVWCEGCSATVRNVIVTPVSAGRGH